MGNLIIFLSVGRFLLRKVGSENKKPHRTAIYSVLSLLPPAPACACVCLCHLEPVPPSATTHREGTRDAAPSPNSRQTKTMGDLLDHVDWRALQALNAKPEKGADNALKQVGVQGEGECV